MSDSVRPHRQKPQHSPVPGILQTRTLEWVAISFSKAWPGSSIHGIFQARVLDWVAISFSRGSSQPRDWTQVSHIAGRCFTAWATRGALKVKVKVAQSCPTLRAHGLYSPWNSSGQNTGVGSCSLLQGIFPTHGSNPGLLHCRWILYQLSHKGSPRIKDVSCVY